MNRAEEKRQIVQYLKKQGFTKPAIDDTLKTLTEPRRAQLLSAARGSKVSALAVSQMLSELATSASLAPGGRGEHQEEMFQASSELSEVQTAEPTKRPRGQASTRQKKVPYTLLLPPAQLEQLKAISEEEDIPVSQLIRTAIKSLLSRRYPG